MRNLMWVTLVAIIVIGGLLLFGNNQQGIQPGEDGVGGGPGVLPERMELQLEAVNQDQIDQSGRAVLEEKDGRITVTLEVNQVEGLDNQPAHIHTGSCPGVGEIIYPLNNVMDGKSVTELETTLDQFKTSETPMAINIHKSVEEPSVYTACGEISQ